MKITTLVLFEGETYRFEALKLSEARLIKSVTDLTPETFMAGLFDGDPDAITAALMILRRRNGEPNLRFTEVDGDLSTFSIELRDDKDRVVTAKLDPETGKPVEVNGEPVMLFDGVEEEVGPDPTQESEEPRLSAVSI